MFQDDAPFISGGPVTGKVIVGINMRNTDVAVVVTE